MIVNIPYVRHELVNPDSACKFLEDNLHNRNINEARWRRYAAIMKSGNWILNPADNIVMFSNGQLGNGQHRFLGVIESGTTQPFFICYGADPESFRVMDQQYTRTNGQMFAMLDEKYATLIAGVSRIQYFFEKTGKPEHNSTAAQDITQSVLEEVLARNLAIRDACRIADTKLMRSIAIRPSMKTWLVYQTLMIDPERSNEFWESTVKMVGLEDGSPILALSNALRNIVVYKRVVSDKEIAGMALKAFIAFRNGKQMKTLRFYPTEQFPISPPEITR